MKIKEVIGIDLSKLTLDCHGYHSKCSSTFDNTVEGIAAMVAWALKTSEVKKQEVLFVLEHTGLYTHTLMGYLSSEGYAFHVASGLSVKRSLGLTRGKSDKADAKAIALYGYRLREELEPYQMPTEALASLKRLMSMRRKLVAQRAGHITTLSEHKRVLDKDSNELLFSAQEQIIATLDQQIARIEQELQELIDQDPELKNLYRLITSVKGVGGVTARFLLVYSNGFKNFDSWRKFACYCGIAPFPNQSGTSIRGRTKVSHLANKQGKVLLSMCASSAIQHNAEMKAYYQRRIAEGKNKKSTLNIIRNKLLARAFAAVKRGTPYVDTMKFAA